MTDELYEKVKGNLIIFDMFVKAESVLSKYNNIACSISGGADSDILIDICEKVKPKLVRYIFFNVTHSKCYTEYGLKHTGCAGCPYVKTINMN